MQEDSEIVDYFYSLDASMLVILSLDGTVTQCLKAKKPFQTSAPTESAQKTGKTSKIRASHQPWPPPYVRPADPVDEEHPDNQALLYKFSGRWDHVSTNTLTNLFLKPDGTYEHVYEAGYSGVFTDQGGYQTGNWAAAGEQQGTGRWRVEGSLRNGKLYLTNSRGNLQVMSYQVHVRGGETYWGEYFFNGRLHSVKYIFR